MNVNGTHTSEPPARPDERVVDLPEYLKAACRDLDYINDEYNRGGWVEYEGQYIAVVDKEVRAHGMMPRELRDQVAAELGVPRGRVAISYIESPEDFSM
jgi:hypothetical protein